MQWTYSESRRSQSLLQGSNLRHQKYTFGASSDDLIVKWAFSPSTDPLVDTELSPLSQSSNGAASSPEPTPAPESREQCDADAGDISHTYAPFVKVNPV